MSNIVPVISSKLVKATKGPGVLSGHHIVVQFENGYGASVIQTPYSYGGKNGLWELGVVEFHSDDHDDFTLTTTSLISGDVVTGYLTEEDVIALCEQISELSPKQNKELKI